MAKHGTRFKTGLQGGSPPWGAQGSAAGRPLRFSRDVPGEVCMRPRVDGLKASGENPQQGRLAPGKGFSCTVQPAGQVTDRKCTPPDSEVRHSTAGLGAVKIFNKQTNKQK